MKRWKKLLVSLLTVSMTIGASTMSVMAANGYTYKVTLSAGNKGGAGFSCRRFYCYF